MKGRKLLLEKQQKEIKLHVFTSQESTQHKDAPQESGCLSYKKRKKLSVCMENSHRFLESRSNVLWGNFRSMMKKFKRIENQEVVLC